MVKRRKKSKVKALAVEKAVSKRKDISDSVVVVLIVILILVSVISIGIYLNVLNSVKTETPSASAQAVSSQAKGVASIQIIKPPEQQTFSQVNGQELEQKP